MLLHYRLFMWTNKEAGTVTFKLREPGFLKKYEGTWTIRPMPGPIAAWSTTAAAGDDDSGSEDSGWASDDGSSISSSSSSGSRRSSVTAASSSPGASSSPSSFPAVMTQHHLQSQPPLAAMSLPLPLRLGGAVKAIAQMQTGVMQPLSSSVNSTVTNVNSNISNLGKKLADGFGGVATGAPGDWGLRAIRPGEVAAAGADGVGGKEKKRAKRKLMPKSSIIVAETYTSPKLTPPYPLNALLKTQAKNQVEKMLEGLTRAAAKKVSSGK